MSAKILEKTLSRITEPHNAISESVRKMQRQRLSTKGNALGRVDELGTKLIDITGSLKPRLSPRTAIVCAADHGILVEKVSNDSPESTAQAVYNLLQDKTQTAVLAQKFDTKICVLDVGTAATIPPHNHLYNAKVRAGTNNFTKTVAMSQEEVLKAIAAGITMADKEIQNGARMLLIGNIGAGSTTASAAITAVLTGLEVPEVTGAGSGLGISGWRHKCTVIEQSLLFHAPSPLDGLGILSKIGGLEIASIVGIILEATAAHIPILLDGLVPAAGAAVATIFEPTAKKTLIAAHRSSDPGHKAVLDLLDLKPILDLDIQSRDGAGALLAVPILEAALKADL